MSANQRKLAHLTTHSGSKLINLIQATELCERATLTGKKVVLAHGVFDLLHLGHVRHLEAARKEGDILIVSVTADQFVNKGPGRPIFPAIKRAEMLSSLEIVDWVVINESATALPVLHAIKPAVYIKGSEYADANNDVTGKINDEQAAVEEHGGKIIFTDDIVYSSSTLINEHLDVYDPPLRDYLNNMRGKNVLDDIIGHIESVADYKVLIVGDAIIDEYMQVSSLGKSSKENMIATKFLNQELFAGGVFAAANHVASICKEVEIVTCLGEDESHEALIRRSLKPNVKLNAVYRPNSPTTRKCRFIEKSYLRKMFEVYYFEDQPLESEQQTAIDSIIAEKAGDFDLVIVNDFGHGMIADSTIQTLTDHSRFLAVNAQSNSANHGFNPVTKYSKADFVCVDAPEARLAVAEKYSEIESVIRDKLAQKIDCPNFIVTNGNAGCITYLRTNGLYRIPAFTNTVVDTVGAGDAFLSITSPIVASGAPLDLIGFIGNAAGALKVGIVGHRHSIEKPQLIKCITSLLK